MSDFCFFTSENHDFQLRRVACVASGASFFRCFRVKFLRSLFWLICSWFCSLLGPFLAPVWPSEGSLGHFWLQKGPLGRSWGPSWGPPGPLGVSRVALGPQMAPKMAQIDPPKSKIDLPNVENRSQKDPKTTPK